MNINLTLQQNYRTQHLFVFQAIQSSFSIKLYSTIIGCFRHFDYRRTPVLLTLWLQSAFLWFGPSLPTLRVKSLSDSMINIMIKKGFKHAVLKFLKFLTMVISIFGKYRSSHRRCSVRKGVLRNFAKFTRKHMC